MGKIFNNFLIYIMGRRGNKKHLKRPNAPKHWMLNKLDGVWAVRPSTGPHKLRECLPLILILRNRLKYALTSKEVQMILMNKLIKVDGKIRLNPKYPAGFMDIITISRIDQFFRLLYDVKGRFTLIKIGKDQSNFKLCKVVKTAVGRGGIPYIVTHDGRTLRYPNPEIKVGDSIKLDLTIGTKKPIIEFYKFDIDVLVMVVQGRNRGRVGNIRKIERHLGAYNLAHIVDAKGNIFATREKNVFVIGVNKPEVKLSSDGGVKISILEQQEQRLNKIYKGI